jgi:hypothetical protein
MNPSGSGRRCGNCGMEVAPGATFCSNCGAPAAPGPPPQYGAPPPQYGAPPPQYGAPPPGYGGPSPYGPPTPYGPPPDYGPPPQLKLPRARNPAGRAIRGLILSLVITGASVFFFLSLGGHGCSSTKGSFSASGQPLGTFNLVPKKCKSGQHEQFFGVWLIPEHDNTGEIKIVKNPVSGWYLQVELPGSCQGSNCKMVNVDPKQCSTFDVAVEKTHTSVNDVTLLDGHLKLACKFENGSAKADIKFDSCD